MKGDQGKNFTWDGLTNNFVQSNSDQGYTSSFG